MGLVLAVRHPMVVEVRGGREALAAQRALVRLLAGVYPCVCVEGGGCAEPLAAHGAHVRPLTFLLRSIQSSDQRGFNEHTVRQGTVATLTGSEE